MKFYLVTEYFEQVSDVDVVGLFTTLDLAKDEALAFLKRAKKRGNDGGFSHFVIDELVVDTTKKCVLNSWVLTPKRFFERYA